MKYFSTLSTHKPIHPWLHPIRIACIEGDSTPLVKNFHQKLLEKFTAYGNVVQTVPDAQTDVLITSAPFGVPLDWHQSYFFTAKRTFNLPRSPIVFTTLHAKPRQFQELLDHLEKAIQKPFADPGDFEFPGLSPTAYKTLFEQGKRGGAILSLMRLVQSQAKCIRLLLVVGEYEPVEAYTFDLVGAHPRTVADQSDWFYEDLMIRIITAACTREITHHQELEEAIPQAIWKNLSTPKAMLAASREFDQRNFFTEMVRIADLVNIPGISAAIAQQFSEGCFATWDPFIEALVTTISGSYRPVNKGNLSEDDLAVITGVRDNRQGALIRRIEGKLNAPPSSEAVELFLMDQKLPRLLLNGEWGFEPPRPAPVIRSKLHGHRNIRAFHPDFVEHVHLDPAYYAFPVSCSTDAQARAIQEAFSKSEALRSPEDRRQVVFTIMPGHGVIIVEKWVKGKKPFQLIWEYMDRGLLQVDSFVPQGDFEFVQDAPNRMTQREKA